MNKIIVRWDSSRIGGNVTYHGTFKSEKEAQIWIAKNCKGIDAEEDISIRMVVPPSKVASDLERYEA